MKYIYIENVTDGHTYSFYENVCIEFEGDKDDLVFYMMEEAEKIKNYYISKGNKEFLYNADIYIFDRHFNVLNILEYGESNLMTLDEWFEHNKIIVNI